MTNIRIDFSKELGKIKPMHSVNNGPVYKFAADQRITNIDAYRDAGIPYARTHDSSSYTTYGGEHIVDVNFIFTDFDRDPTDPAAYDFTLTDEYMRVILHAGTKPFFRLGTKIEHWSKKYNTLPPKDFHKWAVVCEHIIRHYNYGWADGFAMGIEYWEIWNEPDLDPDDSTHKRTWGGTKAQFFDLYEIAAKHLKSCFPELKIGGPALARASEWAADFLAEMRRREVPIDFFSWHKYGSTVESIQEKIALYRQMLDDNGYECAESILNEWNYVKGWRGDDWIYSLKTEKGMKGAAFIAATMLMSQKAALDNLMYYDARPCGMNGMFCTDFVFETLKGYYPFYQFNQLYRQGREVESKSDTPEVWVVGAKGEEQNVMLAYYADDDTAEEKQVKVSFENVENENGIRLEYYVLDENHDNALLREEIFTAKNFASYITMPRNSTCLLKMISL